MKDRPSELLTMVPVIDDLYWIKKGNPWEYYHTAFHHHPEIQLDYIIQGNGSQLIGNSYLRFKKGDLILLGQDLPHLRRPDDMNKKKAEREISEVITLLFNSKLFSDSLLSIVEMNEIKVLLENSKRGVLVQGSAKKKVKKLLERSLTEKGGVRIALLLEALQSIASSNDNEYLLSQAFTKSINKISSNRMSTIYAYAMEHFDSQITIKEIAEVANLSEHSFCRFFKNNFNCSFTSFVNELRINKARELLSDTELPISHICFECGFNNFTNFNKSFKKLNSMNPSEYRKRFGVFR